VGKYDLNFCFLEKMLTGI